MLPLHRQIRSGIDREQHALFPTPLPQTHKNHPLAGGFRSGAGRDRTDDLMLAKHHPNPTKPLQNTASQNQRTYINVQEQYKNIPTV